MSIFKHKNLRNQLVSVTLLIVLVPLLLMGLYFFRSKWVASRLSGETGLQRQTQILEMELNFHLVEKWEDQLTFWASGRSPAHSLRPAAEISQILQFSGKEWQLLYSKRDTVRPLIAEGFLKTFTRFLAENPTQKIACSPVFPTRGNRIGYFLFAKKIAPKPRFVAAVVSMPAVLDSLRPVVSVPWQQFGMGVLDANGHYFAVAGKKPPASLIQKIGAVARAPQARPTKFFEASPGKRGKNWLIVSRQIQNLPLWIVGCVPKMEIYAPAYRAQYGFIILLLFGIAMAVLGAYFFAQKITVPLQHFARSATEIARGDFTQSIQIKSNDEIGRLAKIFNYMVMELRRLHEMNLNEIITERAKTRAILRNIADGVIVTDPHGKIMMLNSAVEEWFQIKEAQIQGTFLGKAIPVEPLEDLVREIRFNPEEKTVTREFSVKLSGSRKETYFQARASLVYDHDGHEIAAVTILRDITKEKEIDRMKTELVSLVAHELRSPLTSISGFAELLQDTELSQDEIAEYSKIIKQESDRLSELVNKFLDLSRIEAGRMDFHPQLVQLPELIEGILYIASSHAQTKNIALDVHLPESMEEVKIDPKLFSEVILNLLSNAVKYSPPDTKVTLDLREEANRVVLEVRDQGFGIPQKHLGRIFDKFYRIKDERAQEERGTGLGLSLVREIVEMHKGHIEVESTVGVGSVFRVILPRQVRRSSGQEDEERADAASATVLET